jgi:hypothetical protein
MASKRLRERMVLFGGTAMLTFAILGAIVRRPFKKLRLREHESGDDAPPEGEHGHGDLPDQRPPPATP